MRSSIDADCSPTNHDYSSLGQFQRQLFGERECFASRPARPNDRNPRSRRDLPSEKQFYRRFWQVPYSKREVAGFETNGCTHGHCSARRACGFGIFLGSKPLFFARRKPAGLFRRPKLDSSVGQCDNATHMKVVVATHGHCFDGLASAVVFTKFIRYLHDNGALTKAQSADKLQFEYHACGYGHGQKTCGPAVLTGDINSILDYRFCAHERVNWYFDHHRTAFGTQEDRAFFDQRASSGRYFFEPDYSSCTQLIADVAKRNFGFVSDLGELIQWADLIDSAKFPSADAAIDRSIPEMQLASVVEQHGNDGFIADIVSQLESTSLAEVARSRAIQERFAPIGARHVHFQEAVQQRAQDGGRTVYVDLTDTTVDLIGKFVTYALYPESTYSVVVARLKRGYKISVGYNPWSGNQLDTDISAICARYGGGGHPVVGGISLGDGEGERAQQVAREICAELG